MPKRGPSCAKYDAMLRAGLGSVTVSIREMDADGGEYNPDTRRVFLDPFNAALLDGLIHELLHHVIYQELASFGAAEEPVTEAIEDMMVRYINRGERRRKWWRRALAAKLHEGAA
jgi:hypothetical protein